jgi:hypothetical protein
VSIFGKWHGTAKSITMMPSCSLEKMNTWKDICIWEMASMVVSTIKVGAVKVGSQ